MICSGKIMNKISVLVCGIVGSSSIWVGGVSTAQQTNELNPSHNPNMQSTSPIYIGWSETDITPLQPVMLQGQFYARLSEEVLSPLTATALVLESADSVAIMVSCDLVAISEGLLNSVREGLKSHGFAHARQVVLNATHTHTGPLLPGGRFGEGKGFVTWSHPDAPAREEVLAFVSERIVNSILEAWEHRQPGAIAFGLGHAVIARNRRWVEMDGTGIMYGDSRNEKLDHIEGYEDHDLNLLATYDLEGDLTGIMVNVAAPSQVLEHGFFLSSDYWHDTRAELRKKFGDNLKILPQCSAAGDLAPFRIKEHIYNFRAEERMQQLKGRDACAEIAKRITRAVEEVLPVIHAARETHPLFKHHVVTVEIPFNQVNEASVAREAENAEKLFALYEGEKQKLENDPALRENPRWYKMVSRHYNMALWHKRVVERARRVRENPTWNIDIHLIRLGDMAIATNPFEYYLDFGIRIKARSPAVQTFLVQLCGEGSYVPSARSVKAGGYGSVPASNTFGVEAGEVLCTQTLLELNKLWDVEVEVTAR